MFPIKTSVCVFDAYGTLFDVNAASRRASGEPGGQALQDCWPRFARDWRQKQLQYTWLRAVAGKHCDFWQVTQDALDWTLEAAGLDDPALRERLLDLYRELDAFEEVTGVLSRLKSDGQATAILSNGSPDMLAGAVTSAGLTGYLDTVLSAEEAGVYKPHDRVYDLVIDQFGGPKDAVLFVSAGAWDAAAAAGYGFRSVWINRRGDPAERLYAQPDHTLPDLTTLPEIA